MREERDHVAGQGLRIEVNDEDDVLVVVVVMVMLLRRLLLLVASVWAEPLGTCCVLGAADQSFSRLQNDAQDSMTGGLTANRQSHQVDNRLGWKNVGWSKG